MLWFFTRQIQLLLVPGELFEILELYLEGHKKSTPIENVNSGYEETGV